MDYQIIRFNNGHRWEGSETWKGHPLSAVQDHAREIIEMGLAERVEVRDPLFLVPAHRARSRRIRSTSRAGGRRHK